jgi:hypothetical protein
MPITFTIDHDRLYMASTAIGLITWEEVRDHLLDERRGGGLSYPEIIDARAAKPIWSSAQARDIVALLNLLGRDSALGPTAVVVDSDLALGMLRMIEIMLDDVCIIRAFRDTRAAEQWLRDLKKDTKLDKTMPGSKSKLPLTMLRGSPNELP